MDGNQESLIITTVGKLSASEGVNSFNYKDQVYEKLIYWCDFEQLLDLKKYTGFYLNTRIIDGHQFLVLFYSNPALRISPKNKEEKKFLLRTFFDEISDTNFLQAFEDKPTSRQLSLTEFYEKLRTSHEHDDLESGFDVQHKNLRPILRPYQVKGVQWMLKRELQADQLPAHFSTLRSKFNSQQVVYYDKYSQQLFKNAPKLYKVPSGGLLTDEMGLGKTVEVISLLLMNPRKLKRKFEEVEDSNIIFETSTKQSGRVKCICQSQKSKKKMIDCTSCQTRQHKSCVLRYEISLEDDYMCPFCWKASGKFVESQTTLIVTPSSIKNQWKEEIQKHVADTSFKTLMYSGIGSGWISPNEMAKFDVIITDFNTCSRELYFCGETGDRSLRHDKKFEYPPSPLKAINFWRVVLDEAQMVENKTNRPSQMIKQLSAVHRWATTGTPIEKDSLRNLSGLLFFLNLEPYTDEKLFDYLLYDYNAGRYEETIDILSKVMWRTCKKNVEHEIRIPKQSEVVHLVDMTSLQECFYRQAHNIAKPVFLKNVETYLLRFGPVELVAQQRNNKCVFIRQRVLDVSLKNRFLHQFNNATIKIFFEPLRRLRQDCTIPSIFHQSSDQRTIKQTLKPEQLHDHLVSKTSIETKSALRTICSSINGIAALKFAEEKYDEAISCYNQVLKLAKDYSKSGFVAVDSMLQIHSYNSLLEVGVLLNIEDILKKSDEYTNEMQSLEWKYISKYYEKVTSILEDMKEHLPEYKKTSKECTDKKGDWWRTIISVRRSADEDARFMDMINLELFSSIPGSSQIQNELRSTHGIELILTEWNDKIKKYTTDVNERFKKISFIANNLKPLNEMAQEDKEKLTHLTIAALNCHLNLVENDPENDHGRKKRKNKTACELCVLKSKLNEFECVLFNKSIVDDEYAEGTWNPRLEEKLLKVVLNYGKRVDFDDELIEMGQKFFNYLEALKTQYKFQAKLWVEVNYTVSAFDEINMCKMRMQVVDYQHQMTEEDLKFRLKVTRHEIPEQLQIFTDQKQEAEINFVRLNGRLKYLEHLKERDEPQACPICTNIPKERYFVSICGHLMCTECFTILTKNKHRFNCPVCRTAQAIKDVYTVTCINNQTNASSPINGSFSPKIDEIIRCILTLKQKEPKVKILIFSHWDQILQAIANGLDANSIEFRSSYHGVFTAQIAAFKDASQDITCMMLNLKFGGKGLNLIEATHIFLVEPILNADEELQAIGRVHRIGQTKETFVHRFITKNTIEHTIYNNIIREPEKWTRKEFTIKDIEDFLNNTVQVENED